MTRLKTLHEKWAQDPEYRAAYDALEGEFALAAAIAAARSKAALYSGSCAHFSCSVLSLVIRPPSPSGGTVPVHASVSSASS